MTLRLLSVLCAYLAFALSTSAQLKTGDWNIYGVAGQSPTTVVATRDVVYFVSDNTLFGYDKASQTISSLSKRNKLSDTTVSGIYYNPTSSCVVVAYDTSNIDIIGPDGSVTNLPCIADMELTSTRAINDISFAGNVMYVATDFGYLAYDLVARRMVEQCIFYSKVKSVTRVGDLIILSTDSAIYQAPATGQHASMKSFTLCANNIGGLLIPATENSFFITTTDTVKLMTIGSGSSLTDKQLFYSMGLRTVPSADGIVISGLNAATIGIADREGNITYLNAGAGGIRSNTESDGSLWELASTGLRHIAPQGGTTTPLSEWIKPNATSIARVGTMLWHNDRLYLTTRGSNNIDTNYNRIGGINTLQNGIITNITPTTVPTSNTSSTKNVIKDIYTPTFHPDDPDTYFFGTWLEGIYKVTGTEVVAKYDWTNSPLRLNWECRTNAIAFDAHKNMWVNGVTDDGFQLFVLPADKVNSPAVTTDDWIRISTKMPSETDHRALMLITHNTDLKIAYTGGWLSSTLIIDDGGDPGNPSPRVARLSSYTDQYGDKFAPNRYYALYEDSKEMIWVCTTDGVFSYDPTKAFDPDFHAYRYKTEDGNYLLSSLDVSAMSEDAQGHYWFGTMSDGLYEVSADGTHVINHYTTENSILPSDQILAVYCKPHGSTVYIGTNYGLIELNRGVTPGETDYSSVTIMPSQVAPGYTGFVTIEHLISGSTVTITNAKGKKVATIEADGGTALWNLTDDAGKRVPSGRYTATATPPAATSGTKVGTINVLR